MARINIEDSLYRDGRFINLFLKLKSMETAIGALVRVWSVAQKWYLIDDGMIPFDEWTKQGLNDLVIEVHLAERVGDFVRVCGADEQFAWLKQKVEAGRKGGIARKNKTMTIQEQAKREGARVVMYKALKSGEISKPLYCEGCGKQRPLEGHHSDYSEPLKIDWLCKKCHVDLHWRIQDTVDDESKQPLDSAKQPLDSLSEIKPLSQSPSQSPSQSQSSDSKTKDISAIGIAEDSPNQKIKDLWNGSGFPKCQSLSTQRIAKLKGQLKKYPSFEHWKSALDKLEASNFCMTVWRPCFDDFLNETKRLRAIEGAYDDKKDLRPKTFSRQRLDNLKTMMKDVEEGKL